MSLLLEIAQLPRATFYYHLKRMQKADKYAQEKTEIAAIYHENKGRYGYRRITMVLRSRGFLLNHKTVQRLMRELGLVCRVRIKKYRSYKGEVGKIAPNLLNRDFHAEKPNLKWVTDVTEFSLFGQKLYLSPILDLHNGYLVTYTISERPVLNMVTSMLNKAFESIPDGTDLILHSDQGWQYQHNQGHREFKTRRAREETDMAEKEKLSQEQKLQAVLYCLEHQLDYRQASEQYKTTYQQIYNWVKKYQEQGETGLLDRRGKRRPPAEYSEEEKAAAKLRKLEAENRRFQMENDFLKKLNELEGRR